MIVFHEDWYAGDPWQLLNAADHNGRCGYYNIMALPTLMVDGVIDQWPISDATLTTAMNTRLAVDSPIAIQCTANIVGNAVDMSVEVTSANVPVSGNYKIRFGLMQNEYSGFTGLNGQSVWHYDMLYMAPDHNGLPFSINANETINFDVSFPWPITLNGDPITEDNVTVIAYVQNDSGREVLQSEMAAVGWTPPDITLDLMPMYDPIYIPGNGGNLVFDALITNNYDVATPGQVRTLAILPNGNNYPINTYNITYIPGVDIVRTDVVQAVPGMAPVGTYTFVAQAGPTPWTLVAEDSFQFLKLGNAPDGGNFEFPNSNWFETSSEGSDAVITLPSEFAMDAAYPNPFNPTTTLEVALPEAADLTVAVFNVSGQQVATLHQGIANAGLHNLTFDASGLASGLYFVRATVPGHMDQMQKVMLVR